MAVIGQIGDAEVRLDNAAEEATMQQILDVLRNQDKGGSSGSTAAAGAAGGAASTLLSLGKSGNAVNAAFGAMGFALSTATRLVNGAGEVFAGVTKAATGFVATQPKITDLSKALTNLPGIFGSLGEAVHAVTELLYSNYTTFQQLTTTGIAFGDRLEEMTAYGARVGVSLDVVAGNLQKNAEQLAMMGTATNGATQAVRAQQEAFQQNSSALLAFGLSYEEQNDRFMSFAAQYAGSLRLQGRSLSSLTGLSGDYAKNLRRLSEITGKSADEAEEGRRQASLNRSFEMMLRRQPVEVQERLKMLLDRAQVGLGEGGRELMMAAMMNMAPVTSASQNLASIVPGINQQFSTMLGTARNFNGGLEQYGNTVNSQFNQFANSLQGFATGTSQYGAMLHAMGIDQADAYGSVSDLVMRFGGSMNDMETNLDRRSPLQKAFDSLNEILTTLRQSLTDNLISIITSDTFKTGLTSFGQFMTGVSDEIKQKGFYGYLRDLFYNMVLDIRQYLEQNLLGRLLLDEEITQGMQAGQEIGIARRDELNAIVEELRQAVQRGDEFDPNRFGELTATEKTFLKPLLEQIEKAAMNIPNQYGRTYLDNLDTGLFDQLGRVTGLTEGTHMFGGGFSEEFRRQGDRVRSIQNTIDALDFYGGTPGYGTVLKDFGSGTPAMLHGKEAVLNEAQLLNMVNGVYNKALIDAGAQASAPSVAQSGISSDNFVEKLVDEIRDMKLKLVSSVNMTNSKTEQMLRKQDMTISAIEQA